VTEEMMYLILHLQYYQLLYQPSLFHCGDLNGTLLNTRSNSHDKLLKNFVNETSLLSAGKCSDMNTFYHHAGSSTKNILIPNVAEKNIMILVEEKKII
jgi:hypothetical protein